MTLFLKLPSRKAYLFRGVIYHNSHCQPSWEPGENTLSFSTFSYWYFAKEASRVSHLIFELIAERRAKWRNGPSNPGIISFHSCSLLNVSMHRLWGRLMQQKAHQAYQDSVSWCSVWQWEASFLRFPYNDEVSNLKGSSSVSVSTTWLSLE